MKLIKNLKKFVTFLNKKMKKTVNVKKLEINQKLQDNFSVLEYSMESRNSI